MKIKQWHLGREYKNIQLDVMFLFILAFVGESCLPSARNARAETASFTTA